VDAVIAGTWRHADAGRSRFEGATVWLRRDARGNRQEGDAHINQDEMLSGT
jgi:hypothetical protein